MATKEVSPRTDSEMMAKKDKKKTMSFKAFAELHENHPPMTYIETLMHLFKGNVGTGCYAMADAMMNAGLILGPILTFFIAIINIHAQHMLIRSAEFVKNENNLMKRPDYAETVEMSFQLSKSPWCSRMATAMKNTCNTFICVTQIGFCAVYFLFVSKNLLNVIEFYGIDISEPLVITIVLIPIGLMILTRELKYIAIFSGIANLFMVTGIILTIYYAVDDLPPIDDRVHVADIMRLPHFFGIAIFAFEGIALVLPLQNAMEDPKDFSKPLGVLNVGMCVVSSIYIVVGTIGYWQYGEETEASLTLNLPTEHILAQVIMLMIAVGVMLGFAVQFFVPVQIMFPKVAESWKLAEKHPVCCEIAFRILLVLLTFAIAQLVPNLGLLLTLIGSVCCVVLCFVLPALSELIIAHNRLNGIPWWMWAKDIVILTIALAGFFIGGGLSLKEIVEETISHLTQ